MLKFHKKTVLNKKSHKFLFLFYFSDIKNDLILHIIDHYILFCKGFILNDELANHVQS